MEHKQIIATLEELRIGKVYTEYYIQEKIVEKLTEHGIPFKKEYVLGKGNRVDFFIEGGIVIEVKKGRPNRCNLEAQVERYSCFDEVTSLIIVVETSIQNPITKTRNGKPCKVIGLHKQWGIAL